MINNNYEGDNSASKLRLISFNTNSIGKNPKRRQVLLYLKKKNPDLIITIDTRFSKDIENLVKTEWDGNVLFSSFDSQSRGVAIFVKRNLPLKILDKFFFLFSEPTKSPVQRNIKNYENSTTVRS